MALPDVTLVAEGASGRRRLELRDYLDPEAAEAAATEANRWIKSLRHARVEGQPLRDRVTYRGHSLWWFIELYLHKRGVITSLLQLIHALEALAERERPRALALAQGGSLARGVVGQFARAHGIDYRGPQGFGWRVTWEQLVVTWRSAVYALGSALSWQRRLVHPPRQNDAPVTVAAFVHSAFWTSQGTEAGPLGGEAYIGPVLRALGSRLPARALQLIGVGPRTNFRARRWWHRLSEFGDPAATSMPFTPIEAYASPGGAGSSLRHWRQCRTTRWALWASDELRRAAVLRGVDVWPLVKAELAGAALLQLPWSARAMDEAGSALDALRPGVVVTYAEAGGWGRALILEARPRGIPVVGVQHGFIYRHWLNYLHEPDEMRPSAVNAADRGFPFPDVTLVFDGYAASHLVEGGAFPPTSVVVTGSPRLDELVRSADALTAADVTAARQAVGVSPNQHLVLVASKFSQIRPVFRELVDAVRAMPDVRLVVKCHPAETAAPYRQAAATAPNVCVAAPGTDLAPLTAAARLVVTVNSTVALDAMVLGIPSLVLALPNNLSPFVEMGVLAGAGSPGEIAPTLHALLYDEEWRTRLTENGRQVMARYAIRSDGGAAERAAAAILDLVQPPRATPVLSGQGDGPLSTSM